MAAHRAMVLGTPSGCALRQGDLALGAATGGGAAGDRQVRGWCHLAAALTEGGEIERPRALHEEAVAVAREAGPPRALALSLV